MNTNYTIPTYYDIHIQTHLTMEQLYAFIQNHNPDIKILKISPNPYKKNLYVIYLPDATNARMLCNFNIFSSMPEFNKGFNEFKIVAIGKRLPQEEMLLFVFETYKIHFLDISKRMIDLSNFSSKLVEIVKRENISLDVSSFTNDMILINFLKYLRTSVPDMLTMNLSYNNLSDINIVKLIKELFPHLKALSISYNNFVDINIINELIDTQLNEIEFVANPFLNSMKYENIRNEIWLKNPNIRLINGEQYPSSFEANQNINSNFIVLQSSKVFPNTLLITQIAYYFVTQLCVCMNKHSDGLLRLYTDQSILSITFGKSVENSESFSRNFNNIKLNETVRKGIYVGKDNIFYQLGCMGETLCNPKDICFDFVKIDEQNNIFSVNLMGPIRYGENVYDMCRSMIIGVATNNQSIQFTIFNDHLYLDKQNPNDTRFPFIVSYNNCLSDLQHQFPLQKKSNFLFYLNSANWNVTEVIGLVSQSNQ